MNKKRALAAWTTAALVLGAGVASAQDNTFKVFWKDGVRFESVDGNFKVKMGGRLMYDAAFFTQDNDNESSYGEMHDGSEFRRARIETDATIYERFLFKIQYDFADGGSALKDAYVGITAIPYLGRVRIGQSYEAISLDQLTSSKYSEFMERGLTTTFAGDRNPGINFNNAFFGDRLTYAVGVFRTAGDSGNTDGDGTWSITGRLTGLPWYQEENKFLHVGLATRYADVAGTTRFRARPEAHLAETVADTGNFEVTNYVTLGPEAAFVYGPFSLQGEYMYTTTDAPVYDDPDFHAYTFSASYWLTGESRNFKTDIAEFDRVKPKRNLFQSGGLGAWEVALRYSNLDLDDELISGGKISDVTVGLNWQWNPNMRMMVNYVHSDIEDESGLNGSMNTYQARWQVDF